ATFVRALAVLACFAGGAGFVAYVVALFVLPLEPRFPVVTRPEGAPRQDRTLLWTTLGAVLVAWPLLARFGLFGVPLLTPGRGTLWPALLIGLAALQVWARRRDPASAAALRARFLARPRRDRLVCGVASGFARWSACDLSLVRLVLAV